MFNPLQERTLKVACKALPLWGGEDVLIPERVSGVEALGELFKYQVEFATLDIPSFRVYQAREVIKPDDLIGKLIEISVEFEGKGTFVPGLPGDLGAGNIGAGVRTINGIITEVEQTGSDERRAYYRFTVRPWLWMTTQSIDNRVFQNLNVIEITEAVFKSRNFKFPWNWRVAAVALKNNVFPKRDYVRQFWQTDYDFLCQIWSEWGIYYHFDGMTLVLCDSPGSHKKHGNTYDTIRYHAPEDKRIDEEHIHALTVSRQITPGDVTLADYDYTQPNGVFTQALAALANPRTGAIAKLLTILVSLIAAWRKKHARGKNLNIKEQEVSQAKKQNGKGKLESKHVEADSESDPGCKNCPAPANTGRSISFARGAEQLTHEDFSLAGVFALDWARMYRSDHDAYDASPLGARWSSPFTTRLDIIDRGARPELLRYHGADGRTHEWPQPKVGAFHYDAIENVTLVRVAENSVAVCRGVETKETYERHGKHYRLVNITLRNGAAVALAYEHAGEANALTPSDLMSHHGDDIHAHVHTIADKTGHITQIWLIDEGKPVRQLAAYEYDEAGDLVSATDEHGAQRGYAYAHHLLTRYTDRTGRGMNLRWHGTEPTAKAVREWADDGSYDTKLEWDPDIRLTYVTDAHGNETWSRLRRAEPARDDDSPGRPSRGRAQLRQRSRAWHVAR
ncbi:MULTISPECIES: contractile injection system protein, VgrG/Pvc8 family [unclassified Caballeronia]|uniref:contractile injection system protein, VgrG/Pvc8 family n=1 Tax=unclassified Caballeronia TaxID=2646786 RepID=UPI001F2BCCCB|nr:MULTISPECIES: contractile injection system protein, VgrG/Pvc8 family [unclassified Caballeronia]MCE4546105.1 DUF6531 domain-containing protein [Caballeronia sp. PC1]MCE4573422.1 DUF6531 domain-containing protein [Caballeronia sp. CLC5]